MAEPWFIEELASWQAVLLQPAIERAAREAERVGRLADVAAVAVESLADEVLLDLLERHLLEAAALRRPLEAEVGGGDAVAPREQHRALDGVVELAHVARPRSEERRVGDERRAQG